MTKIKLSNLTVLLPFLLLGWGSVAANENALLVVGDSPVAVDPIRWSTTQAPNFKFRVGAIPTPMISWFHDQIKGAAALGTGSVQFCSRELAGVWDYTGGLIENVRSPELNANSSSRVYFEFALRLPQVAQRKGMCERPSSESTALISKNFITNTDISGLSNIHRISPFNISFPQVPTASSNTRVGRSKISEVTRPVFSPITFSAHGKKDEVKAVFEVFQKTAAGNPLPRPIIVSLLNSKYETVLVLELQDLVLLSYNPFGSLNVSDPGTLSFEFTVSPGNVKISN